MAQKVSVELVDDITGETADETVSFSLDGATYEIDLSTKNAEKLREELASYIGQGRRVGGRRGGASTARKGGRSANKDYDASAVRAWAESNGVEVSARGRISSEVVEQYKAAGN